MYKYISKLNNKIKLFRKWTLYAGDYSIAKGF